MEPGSNLMALKTIPDGLSVKHVNRRINRAHLTPPGCTCLSHTLASASRRQDCMSKPPGSHPGFNEGPAEVQSIFLSIEASVQTSVESRCSPVRGIFCVPSQLRSCSLAACPESATLLVLDDVSEIGQQVWSPGRGLSTFANRIIAELPIYFVMDGQFQAYDILFARSMLAL